MRLSDNDLSVRSRFFPRCGWFGDVPFLLCNISAEKQMTFMSTAKHTLQKSTFDCALLIKQSLDFELVVELLQLHQEPETQIKIFH